MSYIEPYPACTKALSRLEEFTERALSIGKYRQIAGHRAANDHTICKVNSTASTLDLQMTGHYMGQELALGELNSGYLAQGEKLVFTLYRRLKRQGAHVSRFRECDFGYHNGAYASAQKLA
ncbi:MAG: hypothetical protein COW04_03030 [Deltaproteobacteria bacterium CG12_big_fil_rev_8_21_14_0_65_43_10]|nr:MAG: hypothetical protein AUK23_10720 [Deltaproteobacteria bacterium CG2_30_43_15]PIQ46276.1 MAG: hypothetical protein COW04_03030 [Deltaproteobacteria bacterium CG12_big_fil_rev_8_21_14_0_65_43_10]PIX22991.1 MAG: hypothetical protein COZ68_10560 [Deltaproteobacteria bacterium CG_4_8_14_3_um_filter_43_13]PJB38579.1 MAG: hypothetical protein CO106_12460 [Deltaproteobacteria bacterium CG_4_9_14_3_um_filter_44_9]